LNAQKPTMIKLLGRLIINGKLRAKTGLHIGAGNAGVTIGGVDNPVVRDPLTGWPYIPGSSLKGKMRSLAERRRGFHLRDDQLQKIGRDVRIHLCQDITDYVKCDVCRVFGVPGEKEYSSPTRLVVRDVLLDPDSLRNAKTDLLYTEVKYEAAIDRITSAAVPRPVERVPAGAEFKDLEMVFSFYQLYDGLENDLKEEFDLLKTVFSAMQMLEDDFLGGLGSRGSGKVEFAELTLKLRKDTEHIDYPEAAGVGLAGLLPYQDKIVQWAYGQLAGGKAS